MAETNICSRCQSKGLVIYPFRYAILPSNLGEQYALPSWAEDPHLKKLQLQSDSMYGLRTMREGFLYVLTDYKGEDLQWRVYRVDKNAQLWPLLDISDELKYNENARMPVPAYVPKTGCEADRHQDNILSFFVLDQADQCNTVWIAYSQHKWQYKTLKKYEENAQLRQIRMKKIQPQAWLSAPRRGSGINTISQDDLANIADYSYQADLVKLNKDQPQRYQMFPVQSGPLRYSDFDEKTLKFSIPDEDRLKDRYSLEAWNKNGHQDFHITMMDKIAQRSQGAQAMMLALNDSIGIVEELCYWINNANALSERVMKKERHWENTSCAAVNVVEEYLKSTIDTSDFSDQIKQRNNQKLLKNISNTEGGSELYGYLTLNRVNTPIAEKSRNLFNQLKGQNDLFDGDPDHRLLQDLIMGKKDISEDEFQALKTRLENKAPAYEAQMRADMQQKVWNKDYQSKLENKALTTYQEDIAAFLQKQEDHILTIVSDIITWVNTKDFGGVRHPLSMVADDFVSDARLDYRAMSNEVIAALYAYENKSQAVADYIVQQFKEAYWTSHNLVWENLLSANPILPEDKQKIANLIVNYSSDPEDFSGQSHEALIDQLNDLIKNGVAQMPDPEEMTAEMEADMKALIADTHWEKLKAQAEEDAQVQPEMQSGDAAKYLSSVIKWIADAYANEGYVKNARAFGKNVQTLLKRYRTSIPVTTFYQEVIHGKMRVHLHHPMIAGMTFVNMPYNNGDSRSMMINTTYMINRMHTEMQAPPSMAEGIFNQYGVAIHRAMQKPSFTTGSAGMFFALQLFSIRNYIEAARMSKDNDLYFNSLAGGFNALNLTATAYTVALKQSSGIDTKLFRWVDGFGNIFGALAGVFSLFTVSWYVKGSNLRTLQMWGGNTVTIFGTANYISLAGTQKSLDVHVARWLGTEVVGEIGEKIAFLGARRALVGLVSFLINPWVGAALALIDLAVFIYDITKDNELQNWMQESRFGEGDGILSRHFKNAREEADQLILIFEVKRQEIIDQINEEIRKNQEGQQKSYQNMAASAIRASGGQHVFDYIGNTWR